MNGLELAKKTSLQICECKVNSETVTCEIFLNSIENLIKEKFKNSRAVFVAWQIQNIMWGKYEGGKFFQRDKNSPNIEHWLECRIFNENEELHLKRVENKLCGRYITENAGTENFYADSFSRFWGEKSCATDGFIKLLDKQRKLFMEIPCENTTANWYGLLTRNYISSDEETGLSGYPDYRFVAIEPAEGGTKIG